MDSEMSLNQFACYACKAIPPGRVFICGNRHFYCSSCGEESNNICRCREKLVPKRNPLQIALEQTKSNCKYKDRGCTWKSSPNSKHDDECKFRSSQCIGAILKIFNCTWSGINNNLFEHLKDAHSAIVPSYNHSDAGHLVFDKNKPAGMIARISAHFNNFIFFYYPDRTTQMVNIVVLLCGTHINALKYVYEFEITCFKNPNLKIKFNQQCVSDSANIGEIIRGGKCAAVNFHVIKNYVQNNKINFRIRILKVGSTSTP